MAPNPCVSVSAMDAQEALADLMEISSQVEAAALLDARGDLVASTIREEERAHALAEAARRLVDTAAGVRAEPVAQLHASTSGGSVFVVRDDARVLAATTGSSPTAGLVFYDLKTCLSAVAKDDDAPE